MKRKSDSIDKEEEKFRKIKIRITSLLTLVLALFTFVQTLNQNSNDLLVRDFGSLLLTLLLFYIIYLLNQAKKHKVDYSYPYCLFS